MKSIFILFILLSCSFKPTALKFSEDCRDFLKDWGYSNQKIKFAKCTKEDPSNGQPRLVASYKVSGKDAKEVESYLVKNFGMKPLKFECCGFSPKPRGKDNIPLPNLGKGTYKDPRYRLYFTISLHSNETVVKKWELLSFVVEVETFYKGI